MSAIELKIAGFLALLIVIGGFAGFFEHRGAQHVEHADAVVVAKEEAVVHDEQIRAQDSVKAESAKYDAQIAAPIINVPPIKCVSVAPNSNRSVLSTSASPYLGNGTTTLSAASGPSFDPSAALGTIGRDADAQVSELQAYIREVVQPHPR